MLGRWQLDLLLSGWAIALKGRTLKKEWLEHLEFTKKFLLSSLTGGTDLYVLGAGRLLDFPLNEILDRYDKIYLYDADPGAIRYCRGLEKSFPKIKPHLIELTGGLSRFRAALSKFDRIEDIFLREEFTSLFNSTEKINFNIGSQIVSLNLLSQLPLAYRQIFERWILKNYGKKFLVERELEWLREYNKLGAKIINSHIEMLVKSASQKLIMISDTEQLSYPGNIHTLPTPNEAPYSWEVDSNIRVPLEVTSSICGQELNGDLFPNYLTTKNDFWSWHLLPAKRNQNGIICRVDAVELAKC